MLKDRVTARLDELSISPSEAARRGDLERTFLIDILHERKKGVRGANLEKLARALNCSIEYLTGDQGNPGSAPNAVQGLRFGGIVADGLYLDPGMQLPDDIEVPLLPDRRFDQDDLQIMRVSRTCGVGYGIDRESYIIAIDIDTFRAKYGGLRDGMIAVTKVERDGLTMRRLNRVGFSEDGITFDKADHDGEAVIAVVIKAVKNFA